MDEPTFNAKLLHAEIMLDIDGRADYWTGYRRGLQRAFHGEQFGTDAEHQYWLALADRDDEQSEDRGVGYFHGLRAG